ncbi:SnoaL-like domain protein [compost metagenome]
MNSERGETAKRLILEFIDAIHHGDADAALRTLGPRYELIFPGPASFSDVRAIFEWFGKRYTSAHYRYGHMDAIEFPKKVVVYAAGTVDGVLLDGTRFSGVRYIDYFEIVAGKIVRKEVWSDMADFLRRSGR